MKIIEIGSVGESRLESNNEIETGWKFNEEVIRSDNKYQQ